MIRAGVNIGLSHDTAALNPTSMFDQMRLAFHIAAPVADGTKAMGLADRVGPLTPGRRADMIMLRSTDLNMMPVTNGTSIIPADSSTNPRGNFHSRLIEAIASPRPTSCDQGLATLSIPMPLRRAYGE
jgi:hypothetical protein